MLKKIILCATVALLAVPSISFAKDVEGVNVPDELSVGENTLILNGAGTRTKFFIDAYIGALYLKNSSKNSTEIIDANDHMAITLHITSSMVTSEKMADAFRDGFEDSTDGKQDALKTEIGQIIEAFKDKIIENDKFQMIFVPDQGVNVYKNGQLKTVISGLVFKGALFGIWLGEDPADDDLKEDMLNE